MATTKTPKKKTSTAKSKKVAPSARSLRPSPEDVPFFTFRITHQSVYWLILCLLVLALGIWVVTLSVKVQNIYDQIDSNTFNSATYPVVKKD